MGFGVPLAAWLRGPLREWAEDLLSRERLRREGYLDATAVRSLWDAHQDCTRDAEYPLWSILMFQAWLTA
jgi:asparagine synthase (glutamine-hydrolysing)